MPELPEVETIRRYLNLKLVNECIDNLEVLNESSLRCAKGLSVNDLKNQYIKSVSRRGKYLNIGLEDYNLVIHLKMTGQIYFNPSIPPINHLRWVLTLKSGSKIYFRDVRKFGRLFIYPKDDVKYLLAGEIGPEPWEINLSYWQKKLKSRRSIKTLLLDQKVIAGIGNIYADEALYRAFIHPKKKCLDLTLKQALDLLKEVRTVLDCGIRYGGTSFRDYLGGDGKKGNMQDHLLIYQKTGGLCPRCGERIAKTKVGGRSSHFCPKCQKLD